MLHTRWNAEVWSVVRVELSPPPETVRRLTRGHDYERGRHFLAALLFVAGPHVCTRLERRLFFDCQRRRDCQLGSIVERDQIRSWDAHERVSVTRT
jgi:hypothetical protein